MNQNIRPSKGLAKSPAPTPWSAETQLARQSGYVGIAGSGDYVHAVYSGFSETNNPVMYRRSTNEGESFIEDPIQLDRNGQLFLEDTVMADGDVVAVAYYKNFTSIKDFAGNRRVGDIFITVSSDGGSHWIGAFKLNTNPQGKALRHSIAIQGNNIYVVWMDFRNNQWDIYYRRLTIEKGVVNLDSEIHLVQGMNGRGTAGSGAQRPQIAVIGNTVHIAWMDGRDNNPPCKIEGGTRLPQCTEIYYEKITYDSNGTPTYSTPARLTDQSGNSVDTPIYSGRPDIITDSVNRLSKGRPEVYVLYDKRTPTTSDNEIVFRKSSNNGKSFGKEFFLTNAAGVSTHSSGILIGSTLYAIWIDNKNDNIYRVYSRKFGGVKLGVEQLVSTATPSNNTSAGAPILGASKNYLHAIWSRDNQILYSRLHR